MRTLVDIPDEHLADLDAYSRRVGKSRAEVIREAIRRFMADKVGSDDAFGLWADRDLDALAWEAELRAEWERTTTEGHLEGAGAGDASALRHEHPDRLPPRRRRRAG